MEAAVPELDMYTEEEPLPAGSVVNCCLGAMWVEAAAFDRETRLRRARAISWVILLRMLPPFRDCRISCLYEFRVQALGFRRFRV